jgi:hypothetical protein
VGAVNEERNKDTYRNKHRINGFSCRYIRNTNAEDYKGNQKMTNRFLEAVIVLLLFLTGYFGLLELANYIERLL